MSINTLSIQKKKHYKDVYAAAHVVHNVRPALHGDALEHGQHRQPEVVEVGDTEVGPLPLLQTVVLVGAVEATGSPIGTRRG